MKKLAFKIIPITHLLVIIYATLLVGLLVVRFIEYQELQKTRNIINEFQDKALARQAILNRMPRGIDYVQVNILRILFYTDKDAIANAEKTMYDEVQKNDNNMAAFKKLIEDQREQQLFDTLESYKTQNANNRTTLIRLIKDGKKEEAVNFNSRVLAGSFADFQLANTALAEYISGRDKGNINTSESYIKSMEKRNIFLNASILLILILMGLMLSKAIQRLRTINLRLVESEKKYRSIVDHSHEIINQWDREGRFVFANNYSRKKLEYSETEFSGLSVEDILSEEPKYLHDHHPVRSADGEIITDVRRTLKSKSGKKIMVEGNIVLDYKNEVFTGATAYFTDVTEMNLYEQKITRAIIKAQEDERYEIGGELHDNICQILATCQLTMGMIRKSLLPSANELFDQTLQYISLASKEIRSLSHRLAPAFYDDVTLEDAFENLLNSFNIEKKYTITLDLDEASKRYPLSLDIQLNLYRILQEQLRNILKHANATGIEVSVTINNNVLKMRIADNGIGFNVDETRAGIGLANMNRRAELLSGNLTINSGIGNGCEIIVEIPLSGIS